MDQAVQCYPEEDKYFKTESQPFPWFQIDLQETRIVMGLTIFFRDDAFKPPYNHFTNIKIVVLNEPLEGQINEETINNFESELCYNLDTLPSPRKHKLDVKCDFALEGRYIAVIKNDKDKSFISLNEVVPILHGKYLHSSLYVK